MSTADRVFTPPFAPLPTYPLATLPTPAFLDWQVTFLIYLVDMPEGETGGGTRFPELNLEVAPEKGSAIVFNDCFDNGAEDGRSLHAGQPPLNAATVKYAIVSTGSGGCV